MFHVYILASRRHGTLYIGVTNSLQKRLEQHRNGDGSSFVKTYKVHRLVYVEFHETMPDAIVRETNQKMAQSLEACSHRESKSAMGGSLRPGTELRPLDPRLRGGDEVGCAAVWAP